MPRSLTDVVTGTLADGGVEPAVTEYRRLRGRYYGRGVYDFSESQMMQMIDPLIERAPTAVIALLEMFLEFEPGSSQAHTLIGIAHIRLLADRPAIVSFTRALELNPGNRVAEGYLLQLTRRKPRRP